LCVLVALVLALVQLRASEYQGHTVTILAVYVILLTLDR
jgi:hypothetical protein